MVVITAPPDITLHEVNGRGLSEYPPGTSEGPRVLEDFQLVILLAGRARWTSDQTCFEVTAGDAWLSPPGVQEHLAVHDDQGLRMAFIHLDLRRRDGSPCDATNWPRVQRLPPEDVLRPLLRHLTWLADTRPAQWEDLARSAAVHLVGAFIAGQLGTGAADIQPLPAPVEKALAYLRSCWRGRERLMAVPVVAMARAAGVSREHLARQFRRAYGTTPAAIEHRLRLDRAVELLTSTNLEVAVIAERCGWHDSAHFTRRFRTHFKVSPRAMRTAARSGDGGRFTSPARLQILGQLWH